MVAAVRDGKLITLEGDYDHVVNRGSLCVKGMSMFPTTARMNTGCRSWPSKARRGCRIDYCEACRGYLKTYNGKGNEHVLLADWTSLHLDLLARDRGLKRLAASLYEI
jgi:Molybdopterin oxidoreductase Fe4S4 domain